MSSFVKPNIDKTLYLWSKNAKKSYDGTGMVNSLTLNNGGSGYTSMPNVSFSGGGGIDATAVAVDGVVNNINITNAGDYTIAPSSVELRNGVGTGATANIGMGISGIQKISGGTGYTSAPTITISGGGGSGATATCTLSGNGTIYTINLTNPGSGYTSTPTVSFSGGGGNSALATTVLGTSSIDYITVTNSGSGFTGGFTSSVVGGGGTDNILWVTVANGSVTGVAVTRCGQGFTSVPTGITVPAGTSGLEVNIVLSKPTNINATITNAGSGYTSAPDVVFIGGVSTTPATASATLSLSKLQLINSGNLYTSPPTVSFTGGGGGGAIATTTINTPTTGKCLEYKWDIPEISLNDSGKISVVGRSYTTFNQTALPTSTRLKNIASSKYNYNSKNVEGVVLDVKPWDYSLPSTKCPPIPLAPQSLNEISFYLQDENNNLKGIDAYNDFVIVLKVEEDDVPEARWGSTNAVNVRQMSIPTYN